MKKNTFTNGSILIRTKQAYCKIVIVDSAPSIIPEALIMDFNSKRNTFPCMSSNCFNRDLILLILCCRPLCVDDLSNPTPLSKILILMNSPCSEISIFMLPGLLSLGKIPCLIAFSTSGCINKGGTRMELISTSSDNSILKFSLSLNRSFSNCK